MMSCPRQWYPVGLGLLLLLSPRAPAATVTDGAGVDRNPLQPADTTSPRATLRSFQETARELVRIWRDRRPPAEMDRAAFRLFDTLDLSGLPPAERTDQGDERAAQLLEILARIQLPPPETIPDAAAIEASGLKRWTIPNTRITIARTEEGLHAGEFQFTKETVDQLPTFYELVKRLPPREDSLAGFYEEWSYGPGPWVPAGWTRNLPAFMYFVIWHQTVWQWLATLLTVGITLFLILVVYRFARKIDRRSGISLGQRHLARLGAMLVAMALLRFLCRFLDDGINLTGQRLFWVNGGLLVVLYSAVGWTIILAVGALGAAYIRLRGSRPGSIDAALVRLVVRILEIITVVLLIIWLADLFGFPAAAVITSLGVGGLAIALAVRPTLENVVGGFILFADRPVRVGDFCRYGDQIGTVEEIGLRSTRIRSLERTTITVPNAEFSQMKLENFAKRDRLLLRVVLQLRYETTPDQLRWILAKLREMLLGHPMVTPEPARVRFVDFGPYSKDLEIFAYVGCEDWDVYLATKEDILMRIESIVLEGGSGFAFPSQTTYFSRAEGLDEKHKDEAETQVRLWRDRGHLPFPEFEAHERERLRDVLDYPPKGSPDYKPQKPAVAPKEGLASSPFAVEDLTDLPSLVAKLRTATPLSRHLLQQFSTETRELLSRYENGADANLTAALINDLNAVVCGPPLYEEKRFERTELQPETRELLERAPEGVELQRLNRLLLQDAYLTERSQR